MGWKTTESTLRRGEEGWRRFFTCVDDWNALAIVGVKGYEAQIIELCRNPKYGMARQMLVLGLGRLHSSEAEETAVELLNDKQVQIQAIGALGKMKSKRSSSSSLERLLTDERAAIRKEARKAITKIMR